MGKKFKISNDGTIYSVNEDGSITKIAHINEDGIIAGLGCKSHIKKQNVGSYWIAIVIFAVIAIVITVLFFDKKSMVSDLLYDNNRYSQQVSQLESENQRFQSDITSLRESKQKAENALSALKSKVGSSYPLIITDIEIGNFYKDGSMETDFGNTIYSSNTMFLKPRIKYYGVDFGNKTLKIKWFKPDGLLSIGNSSPSGFSQSEAHYIYSGSDNTLTMEGWGNENKGFWCSGTYRIDVWYNNTCLKSKTFTIY